jgi:hypothetical protein
MANSIEQTQPGDPQKEIRTIPFLESLEHIGNSYFIKDCFYYLVGRDAATCFIIIEPAIH